MKTVGVALLVAASFMMSPAHADDSNHAVALPAAAGPSPGTSGHDIPGLGASLQDMLEGEFALQEGRTAEAARSYVEAAERSAEIELVERAARVALLADDLDLARRALQRWQVLSPNDPAAAQIDLALAIGEARHDAAAGQLARLLGGDPEAQQLAIQALAASGAEAAPAVERLLEGGRIPAELDVWMALGGLAMQWQRADLAAALSDQAVQTFAAEPRAWLWHGDILLREKQPEAVRAAVGRALSLPDVVLADRARAAALLDAIGDPSAAAAALAEGPQSEVTLAGRAAYLARADHHDELLALYRELQRDRPAAQEERAFLLGQVAELLERRKEALRWYRAVDSGVRRDSARLRTAVLLEQTGELDQALSLLHELQAEGDRYAVRSGIPATDPESVRDAYLLEAELLLGRERHQEAIEVYSRGLAIFVDEPQLLYARALTLERIDEVDQALQDLRLIVDQDPDNPDALNALGYTLADRTEQHEEALEYIERALELAPDQPAIVDSMGWVLYRLGRLEEALVHLQRAFELQRDAEIAAHLGEVLWQSGQIDEARSIWRLGEELDPDNRALRRTIERFSP